MRASHWAHFDWFIWMCSAIRHWDVKQEQRWLKLSESGIAHFVLVRGILVYGGFVAIPLLFLTIHLHANGELQTELTTALLVTLIVTLCGGTLFGICVWFATHRSYIRYKQNDKRQTRI